MNNTQTNEKYLRQNGYDLNDAVDISNIRTQQQKDIFRNARLGSYNKYGRYIIPPAVIKELLFMKKYVYQDSYNDVIRQNKDTYEFNVEGFLPVFGNINFKLAVKGHSAHLYLLENVYREFNGYQEIFGEQISSAVCDDTKTNNIEYLFTAFNIKVVDKEDIEGKKPEELAEDSEKIQSIMYTKMHLALVSKEYLKVSASDEKETFDDLVAMLKYEGGEYGKKVLKHFIDRIEKRPDIMQIKDEDGYNESLNDILVGAVEVATTEDDMQDPHTKDLYRRIYDRRFEDTGKHFSEAEDKVPRKTTDQVVDKLLHINRGHSEENEELDTFRAVLDSMAKEDNKPEQIGAALTIDKIRRDLTEAILKTRTTDQSQEGPDLEAAAEGKNLEELKGQGQGEETAKGAVVDPKKVDVKKDGPKKDNDKKASNDGPQKPNLYNYGKPIVRDYGIKKGAKEESKSGGGAVFLNKIPEETLNKNLGNTITTQETSELLEIEGEMVVIGGQDEELGEAVGKALKKPEVEETLTGTGFLNDAGQEIKGQRASLTGDFQDLSDTHVGKQLGKGPNQEDALVK